MLNGYKSPDYQAWQSKIAQHGSDCTFGIADHHENISDISFAIKPSYKNLAIYIGLDEPQNFDSTRPLIYMKPALNDMVIMNFTALNELNILIISLKSICTVLMHRTHGNDSIFISQKGD